MEEKVRQWIDQYHMLQEGCTVAVGVSGGADSVCLLLLLHEMSREIGFRLIAVHVEHGIRREESLRDAAFTKQLCRKLNVPCTICSVDVLQHREETGQSLEEAARELRYDCYRQVCEQNGADRIALAHNADDCAETLLFHLARGTGIRGMSGIRPVSKREGMTVIRPLLSVTRQEIESWLAACGQEYCTDSTNADVSFSRNRIRSEVLPQLTQINAQAVPHLQRESEQLAGICDYLDEAARKAGREVYSVSEETKEGSGTEVTIRCEPFLLMPEVLQGHLLLLLLGEAAGSKKDITADHVDRTKRLMTAEVGTKISLPYRITAERTYDAVRLYREGEDAPLFTEQDLRIPGETVTETGLVFSARIINRSDFTQKIPQKTYTKWFDYDKINFAVRVRSRQMGDYFQTDANGGNKKLNRYFIDEKIPLSERDRICLLADADHIMWVIGYRISEAYKVTEQTKRILCVEVNGISQGEGEGSDG